jgi:hypothetical protein
LLFMRPRREIALLRGESLGLQDVLAEAGADAAARAVQLAHAEARLRASLARVRQARLPVPSPLPSPGHQGSSLCCLLH